MRPTTTRIRTRPRRAAGSDTMAFKPLLPAEHTGFNFDFHVVAEAALVHSMAESFSQASAHAVPDVPHFLPDHDWLLR